MKKAACLWSVFLCFFTAFTQTIQYSRQTFPTPYPDEMQLVANIGGYHHLLCFTANKQPAVYIFDAQLQLKEQKQIGDKLKEDCDIRILPFDDFYFLYVHSPRSPQHNLWKIDGNGNATPLSENFQKIVDTALNKNTSTLQLVRQNNALFIIAHTYYDAVKKMNSIVVEASPDLTSWQTHKVLYDFNQNEILQQTVVTGKYLLALKTGGDDETGHTLDVVKADLATGRSITNSFNSGSHLYQNPVFSFNIKDSSLLLYSLIREPANSTRSQRTVFMARLNFALQEMAPPALLKGQFRNNTAANFLLLQGRSPCWVNMSNSLRIRRTSPRDNTLEDFVADNPATVNLRRYTSTTDFLSGYNQINGVRFTVLNESFKTVKDSLVANSGNIVDVPSRPYAQFTLQNKACLVLIQNFSAKHRGLVMVNANDEGRLQSSDIRVFDRYEYLLSQLQVVNNSFFLIPYLYKNEVGLVKVIPE